MDPVKELVRQHWDRRAADFDKEASHGLLSDSQSRAWRQLIRRLAGTIPLDALDIGCGTGFLSLLLAQAGHRVTALDMAPAMLAKARGKAAALNLEIDFRRADAEAPELPPASFNLIIERHVLWTLPRPAVALECWRQLLCADGRLVLIEGQWHGLEPREEYEAIHQQLPLFGGRPESEVVALLRAHAFGRVLSEPLMDPELWLQAPGHPRYLVIARA